MSTNTGRVMDNVRSMLRDRDFSDLLFDTRELIYHAQAETQMLYQDIGISASWENAVLTLTPNVYEYTITKPSISGFVAAHLNQIIGVRLHSRQWPLTRMTDDELEALRRGPSVTLGPPQAIVFNEGSDQTMGVRLWPTPSEVDTIDWLRSWVPSFSDGYNQTLNITDSIFLSEAAVKVLEKRIARSIISSRMPDKLTERGVSPGYVKQLSEDIAEGTRLEKIRVNSLFRTGRISRGQA
jgi:hypothetical protein